MIELLALGLLIGLVIGWLAMSIIHDHYMNELYKQFEKFVAEEKASHK